jgi:hypothetical protein
MSKNILNSNEVTITQMALSALIGDMESVSKNQSYPFTPDARKQQKEMLAYAKSALEKLSKASGQLVRLDPYNEGDEDEFLTKQS